MHSLSFNDVKNEKKPQKQKQATSVMAQKTDGDGVCGCEATLRTLPCLHHTAGPGRLFDVVLDTPDGTECQTRAVTSTIHLIITNLNLQNIRAISIFGADV